MKINTIKHIAIQILAAVALLGTSYAGPATWVTKSATASVTVTRPVTIALSGHTGKQPYVGSTGVAPTRLFNAGQGVVSVPY
jgi:hypothetical protein